MVGLYYSKNNISSLEKNEMIHQYLSDFKEGINTLLKMTRGEFSYFW